MIFCGLNQDAVAVVDLMLNDLRRPAGVGFEPRFKALVLHPKKKSRKIGLLSVYTMFHVLIEFE